MNEKMTTKLKLMKNTKKQIKELQKYNEKSINTIKDIKTVKIFYRDVPVIFEEKLALDRCLLGEFSHCNEEIKIDALLNEEKALDVLIHEMLHCSLAKYNNDLNKEKNIEDLTTVVLTLIKDNKEVFKTIIEKL